MMVVFDFCCGCRMHLALFCLCGVCDDFSFGVVEFLLFLCLSCMFLLDVFDLFVLNNRIAYCRLRGICLFDLFDVLFNSISGVLLRCVGFSYDCRLFCSYDCYCCLVFWFCLMFCGDVFDRFVLRLFDMRNALVCVKQLLFLLFCGCLCLFYWFVCEFCIETIIYVFFMC